MTPLVFIPIFTLTRAIVITFWFNITGSTIRAIYRIFSKQVLQIRDNSFFSPTLMTNKTFCRITPIKIITVITNTIWHPWFTSKIFWFHNNRNNNIFCISYKDIQRVIILSCVIFCLLAFCIILLVKINIPWWCQVLTFFKTKTILNIYK